MTISVASLLKPAGAIGAVILALGLTSGVAQAGKAEPKVRIVHKHFVVHPQISTRTPGTPNAQRSSAQSGQSGAKLAR